MQYGQMSDEEGEAGDDHQDHVKENGLVKNLNANSVQQAEREKREKAKIESQKKKEKDKEDRFVMICSCGVLKNFQVDEMYVFLQGEAKAAGSRKKRETKDTKRGKEEVASLWGSEKF